MLCHDKRHEACLVQVHGGWCEWVNWSRWRKRRLNQRSERKKLRHVLLLVCIVIRKDWMKRRDYTHTGRVDYSSQSPTMKDTLKENKGLIRVMDGKCVNQRQSPKWGLITRWVDNPPQIHSQFHFLLSISSASFALFISSSFLSSSRLSESFTPQTNLPV